MWVKIKVATIANINGRAESLGPGQVLDLPKDVAESLLRAGHAADPTEEYERAVHPVARRKAS